MFKEIKPCEIKGNLIDMISNEWMLISAGNKDGYNMMTASWGFMGEPIRFLEQRSVHTRQLQQALIARFIPIVVLTVLR